MSELPVITTERLRLRPRAISDLEDCLSMDRDPAVTRFIPGPWSEPDDHRAFVLARMTTTYPDGLGYWSVFSHTNQNDFLGWILLIPYPAIEAEAEIGWRFKRENWGYGYASEAASAIINHGLDTVGLDCIVADIDPGNRASIRVAEKAGMRFVQDRSFDDRTAKSYQIAMPNCR